MTIEKIKHIISQGEGLNIEFKTSFSVEYIITGNPQRKERYDYPEEAIREIVLNMIVHRDYRDSGDSIIKIFDDRIEFFNPGKLLDGLTIERLLSDNYSPKSRNIQINTMFKEIGLVEKYGSGIQRVINICKKYGGVDIDFAIEQHGFRVIVTRKDKNGNRIKITENGNDTENYTNRKNDTEKRIYIENDTENKEIKILTIIKQHNNISRQAMAEKLGIGTATVSRYLEQLKSKGLLERIGADKGGYWKIIENG